MTNEAQEAFKAGGYSPQRGASELCEAMRALNPLLNWTDAGGGEIEEEKVVVAGLYAEQPGPAFDFFKNYKQSSLLEARIAWKGEWIRPRGTFLLYVKPHARGYEATIRKGTGLETEKIAAAVAGPHPRDAMAALWSAVPDIAALYKIHYRTSKPDRRGWVRNSRSHQHWKPERNGFYVYARAEPSEDDDVPIYYAILNDTDKPVYLDEVLVCEGDTPHNAWSGLWSNALDFVACFEQWHGFIAAYEQRKKAGTLNPFAHS